MFRAFFTLQTNRRGEFQFITKFHTIQLWHRGKNLYTKAKFTRVSKNILLLIPEGCIETINVKLDGAKFHQLR